MNSVPMLTLAPRGNDIVINKLYGRDKEWWEDRLEKYMALNPDATVYPNQILALFGSRWGVMDYMRDSAINMAAKVAEFWSAHPSLEELLCKK